MNISTPHAHRSKRSVEHESRVREYILALTEKLQTRVGDGDLKVARQVLDL
jgi:hypothetical protein